LGKIVADLVGTGIEPPAMVVVGEAVRLRAGLDWLGALSGKRLIADPLGQRKRSESA
jgi:uroporphyrin-III C-methyltransferase